MNGTPRESGVRQWLRAVREPAITKFAPLSGLACGAFADPWNVLGFQGLFPLSPARKRSANACSPRKR